MLSNNDQNADLAFVIVPVHNRKAITLKCLAHLAAQGDMARFQIVVVDDGSTDGTADAILSCYPQVHVLKGDGNLWWTGAIEKGMRYAYAQQASYLIWLNDDALPDLGTLSNILNFCKSQGASVVASQCYSNEALTFGGQIKKAFTQISTHARPNELLECDALDGNVVCMPVSLVEAIGYPKGKLFPHYAGDNFYTWKAKRKGFKLYLSGYARSFCCRNDEKERWLVGDHSIWFYWKNLLSPKSRFYWKSYPIFCLRYWGLLGVWPLIQPYTKLAFITFFRVMLPKDIIVFIRSTMLESPFNSFKR